MTDVQYLRLRVGDRVTNAAWPGAVFRVTGQRFGNVQIITEIFDVYKFAPPMEFNTLMSITEHVYPSYIRLPEGL